MDMELRKDFTYSLVVPSSMGVRITPVNAQPVHVSDTFTMQATSAETNVATISSSLGLHVKVLTTFVKDSPIARFIKDNLASRHMAYEGKEVPQGNPWGYRHQFNIADSGFGLRGPRVHNDRAGEVGRTLNVKDFDLDRRFAASSRRLPAYPTSSSAMRRISSSALAWKDRRKAEKTSLPTSTVSRE